LFDLLFEEALKISPNISEAGSFGLPIAAAVVVVVVFALKTVVGVVVVVEEEEFVFVVNGVWISFAVIVVVVEVVVKTGLSNNPATTAAGIVEVEVWISFETWTSFEVTESFEIVVVWISFDVCTSLCEWFSFGVVVVECECEWWFSFGVVVVECVSLKWDWVEGVETDPINAFEIKSGFTLFKTVAANSLSKEGFSDVDEELLEEEEEEEGDDFWESALEIQSRK